MFQILFHFYLRLAGFDNLYRTPHVIDLWKTEVEFSEL